jgi:hypothetical protein
MVTESGRGCTAGDLNRGAVLQHGVVWSARLAHFWRSLVALQFAWVDNLHGLTTCKLHLHLWGCSEHFERQQDMLQY